jgi:hypothetical protein
MEARDLVLVTAFRHRITEPNLEAGYDRFRAVCPDAPGVDLFAQTVATCVRDGLIREPIRLPEGALQCHWHLELTPDGVAAARRWLDRRDA